MVDPTLSVAISIQTNPGVYALLLGSGVSRPAGIPTGWEVTLDLVRKLARLEGEDCEPDPAAWYQGKFGQPPKYSSLLEDLASTPAERSALLKPYFEPTEEEREQKLKVPTKAHRAIASMVAGGYVRVIITTNFDRLIEKAIEEAGPTPSVISTADQAKGALPLIHMPCLVLKVNGDYLDTRIKNSPEELSEYEPPINSLLDQIFDEFGLIVSGWSADWDEALRNALHRCNAHRFTTFWTTRRAPSNTTTSLMKARRAREINIKDGGAFFDELGERVISLADSGEQHPVAPKVAVAQLKRYISEEKHAIRLHDLVLGETEQLQKELTGGSFPVLGVPWNEEQAASRIQQYNALTTNLQSLLSVGCYWGKTSHRSIWTKCIERIANGRNTGGGVKGWLDLQRFPPLSLLYVGGLGALAGRKYGTLLALLTAPRYRTDRGDDFPLLRVLNVWDAFEKNVAQSVLGEGPRHTPQSDFLCENLRPFLADLIPDPLAYEDLFDEFEYFLALAFSDMKIPTLTNWIPVGRFGWRNRLNEGQHVIDKVDKEARRYGTEWAPLQAGWFDGSFEKYEGAKATVVEFMKGLGWDW